jgi:endoglucanase
MARVLESWDVLVRRFKGHWNLFALDLKNENHGIAAWGTGEAFTDWKLVRPRTQRQRIHIDKAHTQTQHTQA